MGYQRVADLPGLRPRRTASSIRAMLQETLSIKVRPSGNRDQEDVHSFGVDQRCGRSLVRAASRARARLPWRESPPANGHPVLHITGAALDITSRRLRAIYLFSRTVLGESVKSVPPSVVSAPALSDYSRRAAVASPATRARPRPRRPARLSGGAEDRRRTSHGTDIGGVELGSTRRPGPGCLQHHGRRAWAPEARLEGTGQEMVAGRDHHRPQRDDQFGPVIMFGLGVSSPELLDDVSFRCCRSLPRTPGRWWPRPGERACCRATVDRPRSHPSRW
jgi:hypothetical protein